MHVYALQNGMHPNRTLAQNLREIVDRKLSKKRTRMLRDATAD